MKKFTLMLAAAATLTVGTQTTVSAQATRTAVILEIATGTWCQYCPGAALGADDLHASSASVGIVEHHDSDPYTTPDAIARYDTYYGVTGFPTAFFDGANSVVGGNHTQSMYSSYLPKYTAAMAAPTPYGITATWTQNGANIDVHAVVTQVGAAAPAQLRLQAALTESHIPVIWQGLTECSFVNRLMHPNAAGQAVTVTQGNSQTFDFSLAINPSWIQDEMELVVWVEDGATKQIYNGTYSPLAVAAFANDPSVTAVQNNVGANSCMTSMTPEVKIKNMGSAALTTVSFTYNINGGAAQTHTWNGNLAFLGNAVATLPAINFTPGVNNTLTVTITNSNDGNMANNTVTKTWTNIVRGTGTFVMTIQPDNYGSETTWQVKTGAGTVVASGGPYTDGNTTPVNVNVPLSAADCYTVVVNDQFGDGMCCAYGNGSYTLKDPSGNTVVTGGEFGASELRTFEAGTATAVDGDIAGQVSVYPNPSNGVFNIEIPNTTGAEISIMTLTGKLVYTSNTAASLVKVDLSSLAAGMYMVTVKTAEGIASKKIVKE